MTSLSQLAGTTIAVNALGGLPQALTETLLDDNGVRASSVHFVPVPFPEMAEALRAHKAVAAFMVEPYLSVSEEKYGFAQLADLDQGATQNIPVTGYFTTKRWISGHQSVVQAFTRALRQGQEIAATNRGAVQLALERHLGISALAAAVMSPGTYPTGPVDPQQLARVGNLMQSAGFLSRKVNVTAVTNALTSLCRGSTAILYPMPGVVRMGCGSRPAGSSEQILTEA